MKSKVLDKTLFSLNLLRHKNITSLLLQISLNRDDRWRGGSPSKGPLLFISYLDLFVNQNLSIDISPSPCVYLVWKEEGDAA
jgi:hypothetical protein